MDLSDRPTPELSRRKRLTAALLLASAAVALAGVVTWRERQLLRRAEVGLAACERACLERRAVAPLSVPARALSVPRPADDILRVPLAALCPSGEIRDTTLASAAGAGSVHLVNLWQITCPSCKREFPLLDRSLDQADAVVPGRVRFLPIDAPDIRAPAESYRTARERHGMPAPAVALIDRGRDGSRMLPVLTDIFDGPPVYPLSFVLDCQRRLRWYKIGAVDDADAGTLTGLLIRLAGEPGCRSDAPPPATCREGARPPRRNPRRRLAPDQPPPLLPVERSSPQGPLIDVASPAPAAPDPPRE